MPVFVLWSAPRSRSTAFFRSMLQRGDLLALHEPLEGLAYIGPIDVAGRSFDTPASLIGWLLDGTRGRNVFVKETINRPVLDLVLADRRFLAEARHAFLVRRPEEIAASWYAIEQDMRIHDTGVEALDELHEAVDAVSGHRPVVIDSDDLVNRPEATMAAYCAAVGLPYLADALRWEAGHRAEWERSARYHEGVAASTGFEQPRRPDRRLLEPHADVVRFAARHRPFYERLRALRLDVTQWDPAPAPYRSAAPPKMPRDMSDSSRDRRRS
jgi:hypothetical protein